MIEAGELLECLKAMTENERREIGELLIASLEITRDFRYLSKMSDVQVNQHLISQESLFPGYLKRDALDRELNHDS